MKKVILILAVLISNTVSAQVISEKEIEKATDKKSNLYGNYGLKSAVGGAGTSNTMVASVEVTKLKDNGFVIRKQYSFAKYNDNGDQQWVTPIKPFMGLQNQPQDVSIGDKSGFYFIEQKQMNGNDFFITRFDNEGKIIQKRHMPAAKNTENVSFFVNEKGLNIVHLEIYKKEKQTYKLLTFSAKDLNVSEKVLTSLSPDAYELDKTSSVYPRLMSWNQLKVVDNKVVLFKSYKKEEKEQNLDLYVVKTIELSFSGEVSNPQSFNVEATSKYRLPSLEMTKDGKTLFVFGYTSIKSEPTTDGLFIQKIDYSTNSYVFKKEYLFSNIAPGKSIEDRHFSFYKLYPVLNLVEGAYEFTNNNEEFTFFLFKSLKTGMSNAFLYSLNINKEGTVTSLNTNKYDISPLSYKRYIGFIEDKRMYTNYVHNGGFFMPPMVSEKMYSIGESAVVSPLEYIASHPDLEGKGILWAVVPSDDSNWLIRFEDANSSIKLIKLKK